VEVFPIFTRDRYLRVSLRTYHRDVHFETGDARSWLPRERVFAAADLVLRRIDGQLMMCSRTDPRRFDLPTFLDFYVARNLTSGSWWIPPAPHTPRVTIDRLVITRESWRFAAGDHPFARDVHGFERFVAARRWAAEHGMPRFVFVKVPEEKKPFQVDFESSVSIERLAHFTRAAGSVTVTEMLPEVGKSWLADAAGNRYVSELRLAAVDPLYPPQRVSGVE
jgi:hypothetical protein